MAGSEGGQVDRTHRVWLLVVVLLALAAVVQLRVGMLPQRPFTDVSVPWPVFAVLFALAEVVVVHVRWGREAHTFGLAEAPLVLGYFLVGPQQLVAARLLGAGVALVLVRRQNPLKLAFNLAQWWLGTGFAVLVFHQLADRGPREMDSWLVALGATVGADMLGSLAIVVAIVLRGSPLDAREAWTSIWTGAVPTAATSCLALVTLDVLLVDWRGGWALVVVAGFVALAARAHVGLQRRHDNLERLNVFSAEVTNTLDLEVVVEQVLRGTMELLAAGECELVLAADLAGEAVRYRRTGGSVSRWVGLSGESLPAVTGRVPRHRLRQLHAAALTEHLVEQGQVVGSLSVRERLGDVGGFDVEDLRLLRALVGHAGAALVNGRLADQLRTQVVENEFQALHDALTGLPNRVLFDRSVTAAMAGDAPITVMIMDLDRFKEVNDTLGHATGDLLLREAGERIRTAASAAELVARLGGDEFAVLMRGAAPELARRCAQDVREALLRPLLMQGVALSVDASVGIALSPHHGRDIQSLLRHADVAMYRAKQARSGVEVYAADVDEHTATRLALVSELREAIRSNQLELWYQPKADLLTRSVVGVEALVRWRHPVRGVVPPDEFISCAEQTALIDPLTEWVLDEAMRQCAQWHRDGRLVGVAVNISPRTLRRETFAGEVRQALMRHDLSPSSLTLEITESVMMEDAERASARLRELQALGVKVSVDDFGTGYSSLSNLKHLPVDEVKIDKSFVRHLDVDAQDEAIVASIVQLAHRLGLSVVAEGIESEAIWERLAGVGCDLAQGYHLSRPLEARALEAWLDERPPPDIPQQGYRLRVVRAS